MKHRGGKRFKKRCKVLCNSLSPSRTGDGSTFFSEALKSQKIRQVSKYITLFVRPALLMTLHNSTQQNITKIQLSI